MSSSSNTQSSTTNPSLTLLHTAQHIPPSLKFLITGLKTIISTQLTPETYLIWKSQIIKLFTTNGYYGYLDGSISQPSALLLSPESPNPSPNPDASLWLLIDQNLSAALLSTISQPLLPHLLNLQSCHEIWLTIHHRLQPTNRSRLTQLKHQLYNLSMKDQSMNQYLSTVKSHVDAITTTGSHLDTDDIIHYILNGLPSSYQALKMAIRTNLQPLSLDDFYSLLCSEEANLAHETHRELLNASPSPAQPALNTQLTHRRGRFNYSRPRQSSYPAPSSASSPRPPPSYRKPSIPTTCQICHKLGHSADRCWHRGNLSYQPPQPQALLTGDSPPSSDWILDTGATSIQLQFSTPTAHSPHHTATNSLSL